jgi:hypothetical protein
MRFIALLTDWMLYALLVTCMSIGTIAIHAPGVISAEPTNDLPALSEEQFLTMDNTLWP